MFGEEKRRVLSIVFLIFTTCVCMLYILKNFYLASPFGYCFF